MFPVQKQTILITGASQGLGRYMATTLAKEGASLLLHGRNPERLEGVVTDIKKATGNDKVSSYVADFASLANVKKMADKILKEHKRIDVLINNAGIGGGTPGSKRELSKDGYEMRFAVNYLAPFLLTRALLTLLRTSSPSRIVNVASAG